MVTMDDKKSLGDTLSRAKKCKAFWVFLKERFANELLDFWLESDNYAHIESIEIRREKALSLYKTYFDPASPSCLAIEPTFTHGLEKDVINASQTVYCTVQKAAFFELQQFNSEFIKTYSESSTKSNKKIQKLLSKKNPVTLNELNYVDHLIDIHLLASSITRPRSSSSSSPPSENNGAVGFLSFIQEESTPVPVTRKSVSTGTHQKKKKISNGVTRKKSESAFNCTNLQHITLFTNLMHVNNFKLTKLLLTYAFEQDIIPENVIESIISVLSSTSHIPDFVTEIFRSELDNAPSEDKTVLFRTDSLSTQFMSKYLHSAMSDNLVQSLTPTIRAITSYADGLEVDLTRDINADVRTNASIILDLAQKTFDNVLNKMILQIPDQVSACCKQIHAIVSDHFDEEVGNQVLGSILFLRFVCPAIVYPEKYNLAGDMKPEQRRTAVLISKLIQNLVNGVEFDGSKESYMASFSPFLSAANKSSLEAAYVSILRRTPRLASTGLDESLSRSYVTLREYLLDNMDKYWQDISEDSIVFVHLLPIMKMGLQSLKLNAMATKMPSADY